MECFDGVGSLNRITFFIFAIALQHSQKLKWSRCVKKKQTNLGLWNLFCREAFSTSFLLLHLPLPPFLPCAAAFL